MTELATNSKPAVICDLDGTLCDISHRLHFITQDQPDWDAFFQACEDDKPNAWCVELINAMANAGYDIIFVSGRSDQVRVRTMKWIIENVGILYEQLTPQLFMREAGDHQPDDKLKAQIYEKHLADRSVLFVIDDRQKVVDMWRSKGLTVLQCAEGNF